MANLVLNPIWRKCDKGLYGRPRFEISYNDQTVITVEVIKLFIFWHTKIKRKSQS